MTTSLGNLKAENENGVNGVRRNWWFRLAVAGPAGLLLLVALAAFGFQDNLFRDLMDPRTPFLLTSTHPPAPDYAENRSWIRRPQRPEPSKAAVFFIHPTTYWGGDAWNASIDRPEAARRAEMESLPNYAGPFAGFSGIWAPRYRQASLFTALTHRYDAKQARTLAYGDVRGAFRVFLAEAAPESPIILVGVEQGGLHVLGLLQDGEFADVLTERLAAAYVIDQATPLDLFDDVLSAYRPCSRPLEFGCVVSWGAIEADNSDEITRFRRRSMAWNSDGTLDDTAGRALLCVNPILGSDEEDFAPRRTHAGGVNATGLDLGVDPAPMAAQTSAQCSDGVLLIDRPASPSLRPGWSFGGRFKPRTPFLFYEDTRRDAMRRLAALRAAADTDLGLDLETSISEGAGEPRSNELPPLDEVEVEEAPIFPVDP